MAVTATTDITAWIPELIGTAVYDTTLTPLDALSRFATTYGDLEGRPGSKGIIPTLNPTTPADNLAETVAAVDDKLTGAGVEVLIKEAVKSIAWYDRAQVQSQPDVNRAAGQAVGRAINERIELDLGAVAVAGRNTSADTATSTGITPAIFRAMRSKMPGALRRRGRGATLFATGEDLDGLFSDPLFQNAAALGSDEAIREGFTARYLGINIAEIDEDILPAITVGNRTALLIADGVLLRGVQRGVRTETERDARARATRIVGTVFHGEGVVDSRGIVAANIDFTP